MFKRDAAIHWNVATGCTNILCETLVGGVAQWLGLSLIYA